MSTGRNEPCLCGSGKKYKQCCLGKASPAETARSKRIALLSIVIVAAAFVVGMIYGSPAGLAVGALGIGAVGLWLWIFAPPARKTGGADPSAINYGR